MTTEARRLLSESRTGDGHYAPVPALQMVARLAAELAALHRTGSIHGSICLASVSLDDAGQPALVPPDRQASMGSATGDEWRPPAVRDADFVLPLSIAEARELLTARRIAIDPTEVDLYSLGTLLCRLLTGDAFDAYQRSPRVAARVPPQVRFILDRTCGDLSPASIRTLDEFAAKLDAALHALQAGDADVSEQELATESIPADDSTLERAPHSWSSDTSVVRARCSDTPVATGHQLTQDYTENCRSAAPPGDLPVPPAGDAHAAGPPPSHLADPEPDDRPLPFQRLGHYEILGRLGSGGMGDVYRAWEPALERIVAIKVLPAELARQPEFVRRFRAEATAAARLVHPNIIQIHFIGEESGHHFFAMQYVDGESLAELLARRERLSIEETVAIVRQVLAGLELAHRQGLVHRDIKPGNVLLDRIQQRALLADFGLVKSSISGAGAGNTATGTVMGTVDYIAPEQARGTAVDGRTDLYAVGVLMYRLLSGRLPFLGDSPTALIFQHVYDIPQRLDELSPDIPEPLASIVSRLLEKSPDDRYATAAHVQDDLQAFQAGGSLAARPAPGAGPAEMPPGPVPPGAARPVDRQTVVVAAPRFEDRLPPALLQSEEPAPAPAGLAGVWQRLRGRLRGFFQAQSPALLQHLQNTQQQLDGALFEYARRQASLQSLVGEAESLVREFQSQTRLHREAAAACAASDPEEARRLEQLADDLEQKEREQQEQLAEMSVRLAQVNATLQQLQSQRDILAARLSAAAARAHVSGGRQRQRDPVLTGLKLTAAATALAVAWFALGLLRRPEQTTTLVSLAREGSTAVVTPLTSPAAGGPLASLTLAQDSVRGAYSAASVFADGSIRLETISRADRTLTHDVDLKSLGKITAVAMTNDRSQLACATSDHSVRVWDVQNQRERRRLQGHSGAVTALCFSPDATQLLSGSADRTVRIWDIERETELKRFRVPPERDGTVSSLTWSADGSKVLIGLQDARGYSLSLWSVDQEAEVRSFNTAQFSKSSTRTAAFGRYPHVMSLTHGMVFVWDVRTGQKVSHFGWLNVQAAFSRDGLHVLTADSKQNLTLWNTLTGQAVRELGPQPEPVAALALSPDGRVGLVATAAGSITVLDLPAPAVEGQLQMFETGAPVLSVAISADGFLVAAGDTTRFRVWDTEHPEKSVSQPIDAPVSAVAFSVDVDRILYATGQPGAQTNLIGTRYVGRKAGVDYFNGGRNLRSYHGHTDRITAATYLPDGSRLISASADGTVVVWSVQAETELARLQVGSPVNAIAVVPQRPEVLIAAEENDLRRWNLDTNTELPPLKGHTFHILTVGVSADGSLVASGGKDRTIRLWNLATGELLGTLPGHTGRVTSVAVSSDGRRILSGSDDGTVRLWDTQARKELRRFDGHSAAVRAVALSPDDTRGLSGADDGTVRIWDLRKTESQEQPPAAPASTTPPD